MGIALFVVMLIVDIPLFVFIGWLAFDNKVNASLSMQETVKALLVRLFVPRSILVLFMPDYDEDGLSIVEFIGFLIACALVVWGEVLLLEWIGLGFG